MSQFVSKSIFFTRSVEYAHVILSLNYIGRKFRPDTGLCEQIKRPGPHSDPLEADGGVKMAKYRVTKRSLPRLEVVRCLFGHPAACREIKGLKAALDVSLTPVACISAASRRLMHCLQRDSLARSLPELGSGTMGLSAQDGHKSYKTEL